MIKKSIIMSFAVVTAAYCLSACRGNVAQDVAPVQQEASISEDVSQKQESIDGENKMNTEASNTNVTDLTGKSVQEIAIDYQIDSYEDLQGFGYNLFGQNINEENPVLSPISAYLALSMAGSGADGTTFDEFNNVLGGDMEALSYEMMDTLPEKGDLLKLSIANSAWIDDDFTVNDEWLGKVKSLMDAEAFQADLSTAETMDSMNGWINDKTNGMIDKMIDEPLEELTRMALFNTVYFKGKWDLPFEANDTRKEDFYTDRANNATKQVDMMNMYNKYLNYISNDFVEGVVLPYQNNETEGVQPHQSVEKKGEKMAFIALKPKNNVDIRDVYAMSTDKVITEMLESKRTELVNLKLPKFEVTFDKDLNDSLKNMGLKECFDEEKANFDRMGKTKTGNNIYISLVRQKAKVIVDEEGTEAAAVTEIAILENAMLMEEPRNIYFDEPFIYMIMDMGREVPLFIGIMDNPAGE